MRGKGISNKSVGRSALQKLFLTHIIFIGWQVIFYRGHRLELEWNSDY